MAREHRRRDLILIKKLPQKRGKNRLKSVKMEIFPAEQWAGRIFTGSIAFKPMFRNSGDMIGYYRVAIDGKWYRPDKRLTYQFFSESEFWEIFRDLEIGRGCEKNRR